MGSECLQLQDDGRMNGQPLFALTILVNTPSALQDYFYNPLSRIEVHI